MVLTLWPLLPPFIVENVSGKGWPNKVKAEFSLIIYLLSTAKAPVTIVPPAVTRALLLLSWGAITLWHIHLYSYAFFNCSHIFQVLILVNITS